jgi:hypothetical protein
MEKRINVNEFIFGRTKAEKKLQVLDAMSDNDIRKTSDATILRIYKECRGKDSDGKPNDRFWIKCDRRAGNNWNSTIEFIYESKGHAYLCLYVQSTKTDSSDFVSFNEFNKATFHGYCEYLKMRYTYNSDDIVNVIRDILKEYVYYTYIEKNERERRKLKECVCKRGVNPLIDKYFDKWKLGHMVGSPISKYTSNDSLTKYKGYYNGKDALKRYVEGNLDALVGLSDEELAKVLNEVWMKEYDKFKKTFDVHEYKKSLWW